MSDITPEKYIRLDETEVCMRIKEARKMRGMTVRDLADITGVSRSWITKIELNGIKRAEFAYMLALAKGLDVDPFWLVGLSEDLEEYPFRYNEFLERD